MKDIALDKEPRPPGQGKIDRHTKPIAPSTVAEEDAAALPDNAIL